MSETTYYERNRDVILNRAKYYYKNNKELLRERAKNKYRELSEGEKTIKREYGRNRYHNMSEEKKQRLKEYKKNIVRLENIFHRCRYDNEVHFKIAITTNNNNDKSLECMAQFFSY